MGKSENVEKLQKAKIAFLLSSSLSMVSLVVFLKSLESQVFWKILSSSIGFLAFSILTFLVFKQLKKLLKS
jgi:hypothetical protein